MLREEPNPADLDTLLCASSNQGFRKSTREVCEVEDVDSLGAFEV